MTRTPGRTRSRVLVLCCPDWQPQAGALLSQDAGSAPDGLAFEQVVRAVEEFCPQVEVLRPGSCAIAARGPARYFGGEAELAKKITRAVARRGFSCWAGVADGMFAAGLAAQLAGRPAAVRQSAAGQPAAPGHPAIVRQSAAGQRANPSQSAAAGLPALGRQPAAAGQLAEVADGRPRTASWLIVPAGGSAAFLAPQLVTVLDDPDLGDLLPRLGIMTLGEFAALPAAEAANRFGVRGAHAHRLASGLDPRPLAPRPPAADLSAQCDFDPATELAEPVVFAAKTLADQMHARLAAAGLACVRLQVQVTLEDGTQITRLWRHDGLLSALAVAERVRWQLDGWRAGQRDPASSSSSPSSPSPPSSSDPCRPPRPDSPPSPDSRPGPGGRSGPGGRPRPGGRPGQGGRSDSGSRSDPDGDRPRPGGRPDPEDPFRPGGITMLRLIPDQLVRDEGQQLGLWGDAVVSDQVARVAVRVQAMLGHEAVMRPVLAGGRSPAEQVMLVPFGDARTPLRPADRPWPGTIPPPAPATIYPVPLAARVTDDFGSEVAVDGRAQISGSPAWLSLGGAPRQAVVSWAGPWPVTEQWWDPASARRRARFQLVTDNGSAWLAAVQGGQWTIEASYD